MCALRSLPKRHHGREACHSLSRHAFGTQYSIHTKAMLSALLPTAHWAQQESSSRAVSAQCQTPLMMPFCPGPHIRLNIPFSKLHGSPGLGLPTLLLPRLVAVITPSLWSERHESRFLHPPSFPCVSPVNLLHLPLSWHSLLRGPELTEVHSYLVPHCLCCISNSAQWQARDTSNRQEGMAFMLKSYKSIPIIHLLRNGGFPDVLY